MGIGWWILVVVERDGEGEGGNLDDDDDDDEYLSAKAISYHTLSYVETLL